MHACVSDQRDLEDLYKSICSHIHMSVIAQAWIHKRTKEISTALLHWASWHFINSCLLLITMKAYWRVIVLGHLLSLFLLASHTDSSPPHRHLQKTLMISKWYKLLSYLTEANLQMHSSDLIPSFTETNGWRDAALDSIKNATYPQKHNMIQHNKIL